MPKSRTRRRKKRTHGRGPSGKPPIAPKHDQAYLKDLDGVCWELAAQKNHDLNNLRGYRIGGYDETGTGAEIGLSLAEEHVQPDTLGECDPDGHQRQAWNIMLGEQEYAHPCSTCGNTPEFSQTWSGMPELGFTCEEVIEDITPDACVHHELCLMGTTALRFEFHTKIEHLE